MIISRETAAPIRRARRGSHPDENPDGDWRWFDPKSAIERATDIVPLWVAESMVQEVSVWLDADLPEDWPAALAAKAERCFARHGQFHRLICARGNGGNAGRDTLFKFMRHWLASRLARERPVLYRRLPQSYSLGAPLPSSRRIPAAARRP